MHRALRIIKSSLAEFSQAPAKISPTRTTTSRIRVSRKKRDAKIKLAKELASGWNKMEHLDLWSRTTRPIYPTQRAPQSINKESFSIPSSSLVSMEEYEGMLAFKKDVLTAQLGVLMAERQLLMLRRQKIIDGKRMQGILERLSRGDRPRKRRV